MNFVEKEEALLAKLKETGYSSFGGDKDAALDFVEEQLGRIFGFGEDVLSERVRSRLRGQDAGKTVPADGAASGLDALNGLCAELGLEPFAGIDTGDGAAVSGFVGQTMQELYSRGTGRPQE